MGQPMSDAPQSQSAIMVAMTIAWPILLSSLVGALTGLWTYRQQNKERVSAAITWVWTQKYNSFDEEPFLAVQNAAEVPAFLVSARILKGCFFRRQAYSYAFDYVEPTDGNFPLELKAANVSLFPIAKHRMDRIAREAKMLSRLWSSLGRDYLWLDVRTIGGRRMLIPANDATSFQNRANWLNRRLPKLDWSWKALRTQDE